MALESLTCDADTIDIDGPDRIGMDLLAAHVPLSLLCDLAVEQGPTSAEIMRDETAPTDWIPAILG